jgi:dTDP-4-dehydrorhamnose reductase
MEIWGGHECTVNRLDEARGGRNGTIYCDQTRLSGHHDRIADLDLFAGLGLTALRYPVLWERVAPDRPDRIDLSWSDARIAALDRLGIRPIIGLLHHGGAPRYTSLVDPDMPRLFADYAGRIASAYPHVTDWTPINEPVTTARFAGLYGHWHPHGRSEATFLTALVTQIEATVAAMARIRAVNPAARLVQTEDLGRTYGPPRLAALAAHYNARRWLGWDLLTGRVGPDHCAWRLFADAGLADRVRALPPCPPDMIGINHYVTSDRFVDDRLDRYPELPRPVAGFHDLTAARVLDPSPPGLAGALAEAAARYGLPLAVTESHLGCTREEQMRWLAEGWQTVNRLAAAGMDIRAFTIWSLLGAHDWCSLLTRRRGRYESGVFDLRAGRPRATALARLVRGFTGDPAARAWAQAHPALARPGWWRRDVRFEHAPHVWTGDRPAAPPERRVPPILITGATGTLGRALGRACTLRRLDHVLTDRASCAIDDADAIARALDRLRPWAVINAAGWVRVDAAEQAADACASANARGAELLGAACAARGLRQMLFSSDLVFDGATDMLYVEDDTPRPLSVYGRSKLRAEQAVLAADPRALVIRTAAFFQPFDSHNFAMAVESALSAGQRFDAAAGHIVSPTFVPDLVHASLDLFLDEVCGIRHLTHQDPVSWLDFGRGVAGALGLDPALVRPASPAALGWRAPRPRFAALGSRHGRMLPGLGDALARHAGLRRAAAAPAPKGHEPRAGTAG